MAGRHRALLVATYGYRDPELSRLVAPARDAEQLAGVLTDPEIAGFEVDTLVDQPLNIVGRAISEFLRSCRRDDLALLYFSGHGLKDERGELYLAMADTLRAHLRFTGLSADLIKQEMDDCFSRHIVLILDCCYSGAFPAGWTAKSDSAVHAGERLQGEGRVVLTASDSTQYSFEGNELSGSGAQSVFTRHLVEAIRSGEGDLDGDGDIALDELHRCVAERVIAAVPHQRPQMHGRFDRPIVIARNVNWRLPYHVQAMVTDQNPKLRLAALSALDDLHRRGNDRVRAVVEEQVTLLAEDDSRTVSAAAQALWGDWGLDRDELPRRAEEVRCRRAEDSSRQGHAEEAERRRAAEEGDRRRLVEEESRRRLAAEQEERRRQAAEEARRRAAEAEQRRQEDERRRQAAEAERRRQEEERRRQEDDRHRQAEEAERRRQEEERRRQEDDRRRQTAEAERRRQEEERRRQEDDRRRQAEEEARRRALRRAVRVVLVLVLLGAVPVTLSRFLVFEAHSSTPFEVFAPSRLPWTLFAALPLCAAVVLLLVPGDRPRARVVGFGLVLGAGLCLVETATYWTLFFSAAQGSFLAGPAVRFLLVGAWVVFAAGVLALITVPVSRPTVVRRDARLAWAAVVLAGAAVPISMTPLHTYAGWWGTNGGTVVLAVAALGLVLLRPAPEHRVAGLVAIAVLVGWRAWFPLQQLVEPSVDKPVGLLVVLVAGPLMVLAAGLLVDAAWPATSPRQHSGEAGHR